MSEIIDRVILGSCRFMYGTCRFGTNLERGTSRQFVLGSFYDHTLMFASVNKEYVHIAEIEPSQVGTIHSPYNHRHWLVLRECD